MSAINIVFDGSPPFALPGRFVEVATVDGRTLHAEWSDDADGFWTCRIELPEVVEITAVHIDRAARVMWMQDTILNTAPGEPFPRFDDMGDFAQSTWRQSAAHVLRVAFEVIP